ncbi:MAG: hypothetical protein U1C54_04810 [Xanthomonadaceae bacterium]|nr:hypothetical protein [Xanthomonadaceae bacterium]MDZ4379128.1 hypothetical protein [Xanthomonadaceae bacterium]
MFPTKKISHALIEYAEPLIQGLSEGYSQRDLEGALKLAALVWNVSVMDQRHGTTVNIETMRQQVSQVAPQSTQVKAQSQDG